MIKDDETSPSIILAGRALLVKMHITIEPRYAFGSNFECFFSFFLFFYFFFSIFLFVVFFIFFFFSFFIHLSIFFFFFFFLFFFFEYLCSLTLSSYRYAKWR